MRPAPNPEPFSKGMLLATTRRMRGPRQNPMPQMCLVPAGAFGTRRRPIGKWVIPAAEDSSPWRLLEKSGGASWGAARGSRRSIFTATSANHSAIYNKVRTTETELNMKDLIQFGKDANRATLLTSAQWLQNDLPIRLSHRIKVDPDRKLCTNPGGEPDLAARERSSKKLRVQVPAPPLTRGLCPPFFPCSLFSL